MKDEEKVILSLVDKAQKGDEEALKELFLIYSPLIKKIVSLHSFGRSKKEDFLEEAIFSFWKAVKTYNKESGSFSSFANILISRSLIDLLRKKSLKVEITAENSLDIAIDSKLEEKVLEKLEKELFLKKLSPFESEVLKLYLGGFKPSLIAKSLTTSKARIFNALSRIKKKFKKYQSGLGKTPFKKP